MEDNWQIERLEVQGGFLQAIDLTLPPGLTCIIGPRGSGKSTLAEAIRYALGGLEGAQKQRLDLFKANLSKASITIRTRTLPSGQRYVVRRESRQPAIVTAADNRPVTEVDIDRGTFLPLDAFSSYEIEEIADETLGPKRRTLLDDLRAKDLLEANDALAAARRQLEDNADRIRACRRLRDDVSEQIGLLSGAQERLQTLPTLKDDAPHTQAIKDAARQKQFNDAEVSSLRSAEAALSTLGGQAKQLRASVERDLGPVTVAESSNRVITAAFDASLSSLKKALLDHASQASKCVDDAMTSLAATRLQLMEAHGSQAATSADLREKNQASSQAVKERTEAELAVARSAELEARMRGTANEEQALLELRKELRARYLELRDKVSAIREEVAAMLQKDAGQNVRLRVRRQADNLEYQQVVSDGLHGASVKGHDAIVASATKIRPDELAQIIARRDVAELDAVCKLGTDRARRVVDAFAQSIDPLSLEVLALEDLVSIELNVAKAGSVAYKDAADLSRGQKCTALLPLLIARRNVPLLIDQPEDNLDNHFIFRTVVETINRLKKSRQMIFITHNANIPVLGEADLVVVLGSDGRVGYVEKQGTVDDCKQEIIDLLEGGREAFEKRRQRYG